MEFTAGILPLYTPGQDHTVQASLQKIYYSDPTLPPLTSTMMNCAFSLSPIVPVVVITPATPRENSNIRATIWIMMPIAVMNMKMNVYLLLILFQLKRIMVMSSIFLIIL